MKPTNKQTALKASLFMILAANVSWQTSKSLNLVSNQTLHTTELARVSETAQARGSVPGRSGGMTAPATLPVVKVESAPVAATGTKIDGAIGAANLSIREKYVDQKICSLDFKIHFIQQTNAASGKQIVHAYVRQVNPDRTFDGLKQEGTFADLVGSEAKRDAWLDLITESTEARLKREGKSCDGSGPIVDRRDDRSAQEDPDQARIERGRRNCTLDDDGEALRNSDRMSCNLQRLASIDLEASSDEDREDRDDRGNRRRRDSASEGIREVQDALEPLKNSIRQLVLSNNSKRRSDGNRLMTRVLSALSKVRSTAGTSSDERAMTKIIDNLDKAYTLGQRVDSIADEKADSFAAMDDKISDLNLRAMSTQNPYERFNLQRQASYWNQYRAQEVNKLAYNSDYLKLRAYQQSGLLDQGEFADFTSDFNALAQTGQMMSSSGTSAPSDVLNGRSNIGDSRAGGAGLPTYPQINYQQLGLNNPGVVGGQQPMFPSTTGYPQTSGYPVTTGFPQQQYQTMPMAQPMYQSQPMMQPMQSQTMPMTQNFGTFPMQSVGPSFYNPSMMSQPMRL